MNQSEKIDQLAAALCKAQKTELFALKEKNNPFFKSKYATLSSVWQAARKPLTENGLAVVQTNSISDDGRVVIITTLMHESGQWISGELSIKPVKDDPQQVGSAITYGRRYGLQSIVGICPDDDDGNTACGKTNPKNKNKDTGNWKPDQQKAWAGLMKGRKDLKGFLDHLAKHFANGDWKNIPTENINEIIKNFDLYADEFKGEQDAGN